MSVPLEPTTARERGCEIEERSPDLTAGQGAPASDDERSCRLRELEREHGDAAGPLHEHGVAGAELRNKRFELLSLERLNQLRGHVITS